MLLLAVTLAVTWLRSAEDKRATVYAPGLSYSVPVLEHTNGEYVGLPEAVEPLGKVSVRAGDRDWRLRFNDVECVFKSGQARGRVGRTTIDLTAPFVLLGEHAYIPLHSLPVLLSRLLDARVDFHTASRRIFVGHVATRFTVEAKKGEGMVLSFSEPVNPTISTEPGKLRMTFTQDPIVSDTGTFQFMDDKLTPGARFSESNGSAELTIQANVPVMATFADSGKTIRIAPAPQQAAQVTPPAPTPVPEPAAPQATPETAPGAQAPSPGAAAAHPAYLVVVDAGHGGDERGAALSDKLAEKEVTLAFARKLRTELQARGIATLMLRDSDSTLTLEQRADTVNASRAAVYVALHAASLGTGVRVYTSMLPAGSARQQLFVPWETAQSGHTAASRVVANAVAEEIGKREMPSSVVAAPVRPLNNLTAAAIAVEVSLPGPQVETLNSASYQQQVAAAIASGIANARPQLEAAK
jgi:N-acetylmuramoyl-L-alanine amidase